MTQGEKLTASRHTQYSTSMATTDAQRKLFREKRGEITTEIERQFAQYSDQELIHFLNDSDAQTRTAAATLLGRRCCLAALPTLCEQLSKETALYSRIALSEALGVIGEPALHELLGLVGNVGRNHHQTLPGTLFKKWNYPLPRGHCYQDNRQNRSDCIAAAARKIRRSHRTFSSCGTHRRDRIHFILFRRSTGLCGIANGT